VNEKPRLPRQRRVNPTARPGMALTERDREIIKAVNDFRILTAAHIRLLFFNSASTTQYRLVRLFQHGFLQRQFPVLPIGNATTIAPIYTLGLRGAQVLIDTFGYESDTLRVPKKDFAWDFVQHTLKINEFRLSVVLAARANNWQVETWEDERVFRSQPDYVVLKDAKGKPREKPVLPDGYFCLVTSRGRTHFFLEVDRGRESESKFRPQIEVYEEYIASGGYTARYQTKSLRILIVTTTPRRLAKLRAITQMVGGDSKYCFLTFDQINPQTILTGSVWKRMGSDALQALIPLNS
jgi:protein involved in plasmid replication-relaxation